MNAVTVKGAYLLPHINDSLSVLSGAKWFSTLDLPSGSWRVPIIGKTAFVTNPGLYEWTVVPFALT